MAHLFNRTIKNWMYEKEMGNVNSYLILAINEEVYPQTETRDSSLENMIALSELKREM